MNVNNYCVDLITEVKDEDLTPWDLLASLEEIIAKRLSMLDELYDIKDNVAIHKSAKVEQTAIIKGPAIIGPDCFIGPYSLIRGGVYLTEAVSVGHSCEVKHTVVGKNTAFAHFNFVGDSVVGSNVNLEAGAVIANHYNERHDKQIFVYENGQKISTNSTKFGALIGDDTKIGANAVTSPGTILAKGSIVRRLECVEQT